MPVMYGNYAPGPQRQRARAHYLGFTIGPLVRAVVMTKTPPGPQRELVPLDVAARIFNYQAQASVRCHAVVGSAWRPTPRQFRRLVKNVSSPATREMLRADRDRRRPRYVAPSHETVTNLATGQQHAEPPREYAKTAESERLAEFWAQKPDNSVMVAAETVARERERSDRGFRVVDRRGEHRS